MEGRVDSRSSTRMQDPPGLISLELSLQAEEAGISHDDGKVKNPTFLFNPPVVKTKGRIPEIRLKSCLELRATSSFSYGKRNFVESKIPSANTAVKKFRLSN